MIMLLRVGSNHANDTTGSPCSIAGWVVPGLAPLCGVWILSVSWSDSRDRFSPVLCGPKRSTEQPSIVEYELS